MKFNVLTLFPEMFESILGTSMLAKAKEQELLSVDLIDIRDYTQNKHRQVDDYPYGGGAGMLLKPEPIFRAVDDLDYSKQTPIIFLTPQGETFNQAKAKELANYEELTLLCGHYEGVDQRVREELITDEISIGDYVLTGGELPAMVLIDAVARLIPGVLGSQESAVEDSFYQGLLDYPHYTRPRDYKGLEVPQVLLSGDHGRIEQWRRKKALENTLHKRPDLLKQADLSEQDQKLLAEIKQELEEE
ncbi:tRNA (guanosine(37)-N1)-methyltransferase TrmD [Natroniella sulfidigena]|uniref:tRNA (guanosine(37)-N1)-methyltransferase TrmD n=1 Tax=Natroniella sulfidigena TaxID=723921 RepID=UPI00200ADF89|nr:tRNA (guanosine(37)-N1)-methyltransferase TrmD [Natroniella sulfidigena]MCK8816557.1 tRNA (guanosine(37)-N1)-methyltransferase TrmD [Natroniella sulfidigena]